MTNTSSFLMYTSVALLLMADLFSADEMAAGEPTPQETPSPHVDKTAGTTKLLVLVFVFLTAIAYSATLFKPTDGVVPIEKTACVRVSTEEFVQQMEESTESALKSLEKSKDYKKFKSSTTTKAGLEADQFDVEPADEDAVDNDWVKLLPADSTE